MPTRSDSPKSTPETGTDDSMTLDMRAHDHATVASTATEQIHLRLLRQDAVLLRQLASDRGQTLSGAVRYILRKEFRSRA